MNAVNTLRNKYEDWEEWEDAKEDDDDTGEDGDHLSGWYRTDMGYREAAGVGLDYSERVRRAAAPLTGPLTGCVEEVEAQDLVAAAKKAALAAALATTEASHHTKAYEKLSVPPFPKRRDDQLDLLAGHGSRCRRVLWRRVGSDMASRLLVKVIRSACML